MTEITGNPFFDQSEIAKPDQFQHAYVGKIYPKYSAASKNYHKIVADNPTEVVSMGVQYLYQDARAFAQRDPDYFDVIWDIITEGD